MGGKPRWGLWMIVGLMWILAGVRDFVAPGFFTISPARDADGTGEIIVGLIFFIPCLVAFLRQRWQPTTS